MILCLIFSITGVSASDVNTTDNQVLSATPDIDTLSASVNTEQNNNTQSVSENNLLSAGSDSGSNDLLGAEEETGSFTDLDKLIKLSGESLTLNKNFIFDESTDSAYLNGITISKSITIDGNGYVIDAKNHKLFNIPAKNVTLKNMDIYNINRNLSYGSTVVTNIDGGILVTGDNFELNKVNIYNSKDNLMINRAYNVKIIDSIFDKSTGYVVYLYACDNVLIKNSKITNSNITKAVNNRDCPFRLYFCTNATVSYCDLINMSCLTNYGHFMLIEDAQVTVDHCKFINLKNDSFNVNNGAITVVNAEKTYFKYCDFINITPGTIVLYSTNTELGLNNCSFINNTAQRIIANSYSTDVFNCTFDGNKNIAGGNSLYLVGPGSKIINTTIINNDFSQANSALIYHSYSSNIFDNCTVQNNKANYLVRWTGELGSLTNSTITDNELSRNSLIEITNNTRFNEDGNTIRNNTNVPLYAEDIVVIPFTINDYIVVNDSESLDKAISDLYYGGIIYLKPGTYTINKNVAGKFNFVGENKETVIINNSHLYYVFSAENITFNNTLIERLQTESYIKNCIIANKSTPLNIVKFGENVINTTFINCKSNILRIYGYSNFYTYENLTFENCQGSIVKQNDGTLTPYGIFVLRNITVKNSKLDADLFRLSGTWTIEKINITNSSFTQGIVSFINNPNDYPLKIRLNDVNFTKINSTSDLINVYRDNTLNNIRVFNANVSGNIFNAVNINSFTIEGVNLTHVNCSNSLVNAYDKIASLIDFNATWVNTTYGFIGGIDSSIFDSHFKNTNFTSNIITTLNANSKIEKCSFSDFTGHVVVAGNDVIIRDTNFTRGNNSDLNGGAVYAESGDFLTIDHCRFISNNASYGGAVYSNINPTAIMNSVFEHNRALANNGTTSCGGAIYIGDVYNSIDDFTKSCLGNIVNYNDLRLVNPDNTLFSVIYVVPYWQDYKNSTSGSGDGSGKDINNPTNISDARIKAGPYCEIYFINNDKWGSNYYNMTNATINPDNVVDFVVRYSGMVFYGNNSIIDNLYFTVDAVNTTFKDLTFANNTGHSALVINQEDTVVDNCTFLNNGGENVNRGAAVQILANNTSILNSTFTGNLAGNISGANGGAVFINASYISISDCHFSDNQASTTGSHLFVVDDNELRDISLIDCNFTHGQVIGSGFGSGVCLSGDNVVVYNSNFTDNIGRQGAGLTVTGSTINLNITGNNFTDNRAVPLTPGESGNFVGGAVFFDSSRGSISIVDNIFTGNNASVGGGALYINNMPGSGNIFAGNVFSDNHALSGNGGAVYVNKVDYLLTVSGGEFTDNNATGNGGALYVNAPVNINDAIFNGNNATQYGGAIYNNNTLSLGNGFFGSNSAVNGGAIYNNGVLVDKGSGYNSNNATQDGGAIYSKSDLDYTAESSTSRDFVGNRAVNGGALYINGTNNNIRGAYFSGNIADYGSCIYVENNTDLNIYDVSIVNNHVTNGSQASGGHGDIYLGNVVNFAIPDDGLFLEPETTGSSTYDQYIYNSTDMVRSDVLYVSESGTGLGLMSSEPTTLDKALDAINDNGRIIFVESYMLNTTIINRNVTLAGYNNTISMKRNNTTAGENKYLFNPLKKIKNLSLNNYLSS